MKDVNLMDMLNAREIRAATQDAMLKRYQKPLICLTLNIPGARKVFGAVPKAFLAACSNIEALLLENDIYIVKKHIVNEDTGYEAFYSVNGEPDSIKKLMIELEERNDLGRLFDIDVFHPSGYKISREDMGYLPRKCLLCDDSAHNCSRSRRHSVAELLTCIETILQASVQKG